ncbi:MAG: amidohydrolase, partial [Porticoccaceae bacterium]|nr:amidohydrolase [Porticoccaceae bacterium]
MRKLKQLSIVFLLSLASLGVSAAESGSELATAINSDYDSRLGKLFIDFHQNPELSLVEFKTAKKIAAELRASGFKVTENVGGTGVVAILKNGPGPLVMMRGDIDGLPVEEKSGLAYKSVAKQVPATGGNPMPVMHACGHDVH